MLSSISSMQSAVVLVLWLAVLGVAVAVGFVTSVLSMFRIVAFVAAAVYLADVRPALAQVTGRGGRGRQGPYGPW